MIIDFAELDRVLATFTAPDAMRAVEATRELARRNGAVITKGDGTVSTSELRGTYRRRAKSPRLSPESAGECTRLAALAEQCADERWHIYGVKIEDDERTTYGTVFANEAAIGRICFLPFVRANR